MTNNEPSKKSSLSSRILEQENSDKTCPDCGTEMEVKNIKRGIGFSPKIDILKCSHCGYMKRKRSLREILRDLGELNESE